MEKVKLTQEQASAINDCRNIVGDEMLIEMQVNRRNSPWRNKWNAINELDLLTLVDALRIGYEVESEFKVGDWVFIDYGEAGTEIGFIKGWINEPHSFYIDKCHFGANVNEARHATPEEIAKEKERRWWAKHGRDVWELKEGDVLKENGGTSHPVVVTRENKTDDGHDRTPSFNFIFTEMDCIKKNFRVVCFADDRKDV